MIINFLSSNIKLIKIFCLTCCVICSVLCITYALITIFVNNEKNKLEKLETKYCNTEACNAAGKYIIQNMNLDVDPCDDFYEYACGGFINEAVIPNNSLAVGLSLDVYKTIREQMKNSIVNKTATPNEPKTIEKLRRYYQACVTDWNNTDSDKAYIKILNDSGGWPVLQENSWNETNFKWDKTIIQLNKYGFEDNLIIGFNIKINKHNHTLKHVNIFQGLLNLYKFNLQEGFENKYVKSYYQFMIDIAEFFGANRTLAEKDANETLIFSMKLANITMGYEEYLELEKNQTDNLITINELQSRYPFIDWLDFLNSNFEPYVTLNSTEQVIISSPSYFEKLGNLLNSTSPRTLANYIFWCTTTSASGFLSYKTRNIKYESLKSIVHFVPIFSREETCFSQTLYFFPLASSSLYVRNFVNRSTKADVEKILFNIRDTFKNLITRASWLDNETTSLALEKLNLLESAVGYPEELLDDNEIDNFYEKWKIIDGNYFQTLLEASKFYKRIDIELLREPYKRIDWEGLFGNALEINAYYKFQANAIIIPSGILQGYFYNIDRPNYLNYATIGSIIGHEIMHAFDNVGRLYDKEGNRFDWWTNETEKKFNDKAECFAKQYISFANEEYGIEVNGNLTLGEIIADNGGLKKAFSAYNNHLTKNGKDELKLQGLESFTNRQMFWISYASKFCDKFRPEILNQTVLYSSHPPSKFRVNNPLSNIADFANDFNCSIDSKMNPIEKCSIW